jgi:hypothetical protein
MTDLIKLCYNDKYSSKLFRPQVTGALLELALFLGF